MPRRRRTLRRLDAVRAYRSPADTDDIADSIGQRPAVHEEVAGTIAASLRPLAVVLFTSVRDQPVLRVPASDRLRSVAQVRRPSANSYRQQHWGHRS